MERKVFVIFIGRKRAHPQVNVQAVHCVQLAGCQLKVEQIEILGESLFVGRLGNGDRSDLDLMRKNKYIK